MMYQATGVAISSEIITSNRKSRDNSAEIFSTDAPSTFLIPISLIRFSAMYAASPNKPKQEMNIVSPANNAVNVPIRCVLWNFSL